MSSKHGCQKFPVWRMCFWKNIQSGPKTHVWGSMWVQRLWRNHSSESVRIMQTFLTLVYSPGKHLFLQNPFFLRGPLILFYSWEPLSALPLTGYSLLYRCTVRITFLVNTSSQTYTREDREIINTLPGVVYDHVISSDFHAQCSIRTQEDFKMQPKCPASTAAPPLGVSS